MWTKRSERLKALTELLKNNTFSQEEKHRLIRQEVGNNIAWLRRDIRALVQGREAHYSLIRQCKALLETTHDINRSLNIMEHMEDIKDTIQTYDKCLADHGRFAILLLEMYERYGASLQDFAQVTGCNQRRVEKACSKIINRRKGKGSDSNHGIFVDLIYVANVEEPVMRSEPYGYLGGWEWHVPLNAAIFEHFFAEMDRNPGFKTASDDALIKRFPQTTGEDQYLFNN